MNIETEFKYVVSNLPSNLEEPYEITQIYFNGQNKYQILKQLFPLVDLDRIHTFRLRKIIHGKIFYVVTLKTSGTMSREEYEVEVNEEIASKLYNNNVESVIIKNRYLLKVNNYTFEFDEYLNLKEPLITCEIEIDNNDLVLKQIEIEKIFRDIIHVDFENVTNDSRYKNSNLIKYFG